MPFIHEWHGVNGSEYTRMARSERAILYTDGTVLLRSSENSLCAKARKGPLPWGNGPEQMDMAEAWRKLHQALHQDGRQQVVTASQQMRPIQRQR